MRVLVACEFSGRVRDAFLAKGHDAWSCDLLPTESVGPHIQGNVLDILDDKWDLMIAHPPCTYLTCAGNKWYLPKYADRFPDRSKQREDALIFVARLATASISKIAIENPIGAISSWYRKPTQIIQPWQFGHADRKSTCLWLKNLPSLIPTDIVDAHIKYNRNGKTASCSHDAALALPADIRWKVRSLTYLGIAKAMAEQWG